MKPFDVESSEKYCIFQNGDCWFCFPALAVQNVSARPAIAPVPLSDPILRGTCHIHNEFLATFSLEALASLPSASPAGAEQQMIVINGPCGAWGLLVDKVSGLAPLEISLSPRTELDGGWSAVVIGSASYLGTIVQVLDPANLYRLAQTRLENFWEQSAVDFAAESSAGRFNHSELQELTADT